MGGALEVRGLSVGKVLRDLDLVVQPGECVAVVGATGSGKSVLVRALCGLVPSQGEVSAGGVSSRAQGWDALRERLGVLMAQPGLLDDLTVWSNVAYRLERAGAPDVTSRVETVLREFGLLEHAQKLPSALSGGMRRRAALARALVHRPACLLLDDPTAGLDPITTVGVVDFILEAAQRHGAAVLLTTHDLLRVAARAQPVRRLHNGTLHALGADPGHWAAELSA